MSLFGRKGRFKRGKKRGAGLQPASFNTQTTTPGGTTVNKTRSGTLTAAPATMTQPTGTTAATSQIAAPAAQGRPLGAQAPDLGPSLDMPPALQQLIAGGKLPVVNLAAVNKPIPTGTGTSNKGASVLD